MIVVLIVINSSVDIGFLQLFVHLHARRSSVVVGVAAGGVVGSVGGNRNATQSSLLL